MKLNKEEQEIEALFERNEIVLSKPDETLLGELRTATQNTFSNGTRLRWDVEKGVTSGKLVGSIQKSENITRLRCSMDIS